MVNIVVSLGVIFSREKKWGLLNNSIKHFDLKHVPLLFA